MNQDARERRDRELIREYLNDAPVRFGERELKAGMNNYKMMGSEESNWKDSCIAPDGWKEFSQSKTIGITLEPRIFERTDKIWRKTLLRSSKSDNDDEEHHNELSRHSGRIKRGKVEPKMKRIWKRSWTRHMTDEIHTYIKLWKGFENNSGIIRRVR